MSPEDESRERGFEVTDASVKAVLVTGLIVALGTAAALGTVRLMMLGPENKPAAFGITSREFSFTHGPEYETGIQESWNELERELQQTMSGYGWTDREQEIVRIPVERAMELIVEEAGGQP